MKISIVIIAKNEAKLLPDCLKSAKFADEIVLVDDQSNDQTVTIAKQFGAKVLTRTLDGFAKQKNFAVSQASNDWVFVLDADERISPELATEIQQLPIKSSATVYQVPRRNYIGRKLILHGGLYPDWQDRLFDRRSAQYGDRQIHETLKHSQGQVEHLKNPLIHSTYANLGEYRGKVVLYSRRQAEEDFRLNQVAPYHETASLLKEFLYRYVRLRGFLDGYVGLMSALYLTRYKKLYYKRVKELAQS